MKQIIKRIAALLCTGVMLTMGTLPAAAAEEEAAYTLPSGKTIEEVDKSLQLYVDNRYTECAEFMGAALVGVYCGDEILLERYYGKTDIANDIPADENACFEWGSITKTFIWVSAFQLWEQGKLDLDKDVREYLPEGFFQHLSYDEPITMLHLMNHNAGWQETTFSIMTKDENAIGSLKDELQAIEPAQVFRPGEVYAYSNYGAGVAGYVIECITGESFCDYVHEHIFEPLGMEHTAVKPTHSDNPWVQEQRSKMHAYEVSAYFDKAFDLGTNTGYVPAYPAGAATGTLRDMMRYGAALVDESAPLFQSPETQKLMFSPTAFYSESDIPMCCHGFWPEERAVRGYGHTGGTNFGQAELLFDPESKVGIAVMVNEPQGNWALEEVHRQVFGFLSPEKYGSKTYGKADIKGYFIPARSTHTGMEKYSPYLMAVNAEQLGLEDIDYIQGGVLQQIQEVPEHHTKAAALLGERVTPDNKLIALESPSCDLLPDPFYLLHIALLAVYILLGLAVFFLLEMRIRLHKAGWFKTYAGSKVMLAGQLARLASVIVWLASYVVATKTMGLTPGSARVIGILQMICIAVCAAAAVGALVSMTSKKEKASPARYLVHACANTVTVAAIVFFEMYRFWGI